MDNMKKTVAQVDYGKGVKPECIIITKHDMYAGFCVNQQSAGPWCDTVQEAVDAMEEFIPVAFEWKLD